MKKSYATYQKKTINYIFDLYQSNILNQSISIVFLLSRSSNVPVVIVELDHGCDEDVRHNPLRADGNGRELDLADGQARCCGCCHDGVSLPVKVRS